MSISLFSFRKFWLPIFLLICVLFLCVYSIEKIGWSLHFLVLAVSSFIGIYLLILKKSSEILLMGVVLAFVGILYSVICPFECVPDEPAHFMRAFEISMGHLIPQHLQGGAVGDILPDAVADYWNRGAIIDWEHCSEVGSLIQHCIVLFLISHSLLEYGLHDI